ncbi:MAG: CHC2 zinc finger domain-containing protein [Pirellulales bacterium]
MASIDFHAIRSLVTMRQVLDLLGFVAVEMEGDQIRGPCPIHGASSPNSRSFSANVAKGAFHCFGCHAKGNHFDLWAAATDQNLHGAATDLGNRLSISVPTKRPGKPPVRGQQQPEKRNPY